LVNGTETVVFDNEVTGSAVSSISTGNILNGDEDGWYTVIVRKNAEDQTSYIRLNGDGANNYGLRGISATDTTVADASSTAYSGIYTGGGGAGSSSFSITKIYAKSGAVRLANTTTAAVVVGTTVTFLYVVGTVWNNTADNIVSMTLACSSGNNLGVGTRMIILKSNNFTGGTPTGVITTPYIQGSWVRVGSQVLTGTTTSVTFSGLDGDRDVIYCLSGVVLGAAGTSGNIAQLHFNSDAGTNYGYQRLTATDTTVAAARGTDTKNSLTNFTAGYYGHFNHLVFAKSGFIRPSINQYIDRVTGTTITQLACYGQSWNNTANNITSMLIDSDYGANAFAAGSQFDLYALRPGG
jgi:hypothetical protein